MSVDYREETLLFFQCDVTSDPSTPPTVRWYSSGSDDDLTRSETPCAFVATKTLVMTIDPKSFANCAKYLGKYRCVGSNGYTRDNSTVMVTFHQVITLYYNLNKNQINFDDAIVPHYP